MRTNAFLTCLNYYGISTGTSNALEGLYAFDSGTTGLIYNQLYTTGLHFIDNNILAQALPLVHVSPTLSFGTFFSGNNVYRMGYQHSGNFGVVLDIESNGCWKRSGDFSGTNEIILSTVDNLTNLASGFCVGVLDSNRLFFQTQNKQTTLSKELSSRDFVYIGLSEKKYVDIGIFNLVDDKFYVKSVLVDNVLDTPNIYIGGFFDNTNIEYTGFYGNIYSAFLFKDTLLDEEVQLCGNCSFATGYNQVSGIVSASGYQITGTYFSGVQEYTTTGSSIVTGVVAKQDGSFVNVVFSSGMQGYVSSGELVFPMFEPTGITGLRIDTAFLYDYDSLASFAKYTIDFHSLLTSGDIVEIYTYPRHNENLGLHIEGLTWPDKTGFIQLFGNGLAETLNVDYLVSRNAISGFNESDNLAYDILASPSVIISYSGYWARSRIAMSGDVWFPPTSQFEETDGRIIITGLDKVCFNNLAYPVLGYDIYLNGQKLISGLQYSIATSGSDKLNVILSGENLPDFGAELLYNPTGGLPTGIGEVFDNELAFLSKYSGSLRYLFEITGEQTSLNNLTGYSEQVWLNGIRQYNTRDYAKYTDCLFSSGTVDFSILNYSLYSSLNLNTTGYWNFIAPAKYNVTGVFWDTTGYNIYWSNNNTNSYPVGPFIDIQSKLNYPDGAFDTYWTTSGWGWSDDTGLLGWVPSSRNHFGTARVRYHSGNLFGEFGEVMNITGIAEAPLSFETFYNILGDSVGYTATGSIINAFDNYTLEVDKEVLGNYESFVDLPFPDFFLADIISISSTGYNYRGRFKLDNLRGPYLYWHWGGEF